MKKLILILAFTAILSAQLCSENAIGFLCLTDADAQKCADNLALVSYDEIENPQPITNTCVDDITDANETFYTFDLQYTVPEFDFNTQHANGDCYTQHVIFAGVELAESNTPTDDFDIWYFDPVDHNIVFKIYHDDIDNGYYHQCTRDENDDEFIWQCFSDLEVKFGGVLQFTYQFKITIYLSRVYENQLNITVTRNEVVGDCCENILNIETTLQFCEDLSCEDYLPSEGQIFERKEDVFVEHSIVSPEFKYYYLHYMTLKLGHFTPDIEKRVSDVAGVVRYQFQSNIAMPNMVIEAVSRISETPQPNLGLDRRMLMRELQQNENQNQDIGDDYKIKATNTMSVLTEEEMRQLEEKDEVENGVIAGIAIFALLIPTFLAGSVLYFLKLKGAKRAAEQRYQESQKPALANRRDSVGSNVSSE